MTDAFKAVRRNAVNALSELAGFIDGRPEGRAIESGILTLLDQLEGMELAFEDEDAAASAVRGGGRMPRPRHRPYRARRGHVLPPAARMSPRP